MDKDKNYYKILGVKANASVKDIKKAYYSLAKAVHPDKCTDTNAVHQFQAISEAYEYLSDPAKRRVYDAARWQTYSNAYNQEPSRPAASAYGYGAKPARTPAAARATTPQRGYPETRPRPRRQSRDPPPSRSGTRPSPVPPRPSTAPKPAKPKVAPTFRPSTAQPGSRPSGATPTRSSTSGTPQAKRPSSAKPKATATPKPVERAADPSWEKARSEAEKARQAAEAARNKREELRAAASEAKERKRREREDAKRAGRAVPDDEQPSMYDDPNGAESPPPRRPPVVFSPRSRAPNATSDGDMAGDGASASPPYSKGAIPRTPPSGLRNSPPREDASSRSHMPWSYTDRSPGARSASDRGADATSAYSPPQEVSPEERPARRRRAVRDAHVRSAGADDDTEHNGEAWSGHGQSPPRRDGDVFEDWSAGDDGRGHRRARYSSDSGSERNQERSASHRENGSRADGWRDREGASQDTTSYDDDWGTPGTATDVDQDDHNHRDRDHDHRGRDHDHGRDHENDAHVRFARVEADGVGREGRDETEPDSRTYSTTHTDGEEVRDDALRRGANADSHHPFNVSAGASEAPLDFSHVLVTPLGGNAAPSGNTSPPRGIHGADRSRETSPSRRASGSHEAALGGVGGQAGYGARRRISIGGSPPSAGSPAAFAATSPLATSPRSSATRSADLGSGSPPASRGVDIPGARDVRVPSNEAYSPPRSPSRTVDSPLPPVSTPRGALAMGHAEAAYSPPRSPSRTVDSPLPGPGSPGRSPPVAARRISELANIYSARRPDIGPVSTSPPAFRVSPPGAISDVSGSPPRDTGASAAIPLGRSPPTMAGRRDSLPVSGSPPMRSHLLSGSRRESLPVHLDTAPAASRSSSSRDSTPAPLSSSPPGVVSPRGAAARARTLDDSPPRSEGPPRSTSFVPDRPAQDDRPLRGADKPKLNTQRTATGGSDASQAFARGTLVVNTPRDGPGGGVSPFMATSPPSLSAVPSPSAGYDDGSQMLSVAAMRAARREREAAEKSRELEEYRRAYHQDRLEAQKRRMADKHALFEAAHPGQHPPASPGPRPPSPTPFSPAATPFSPASAIAAGVARSAFSQDSPAPAPAPARRVSAGYRSQSGGAARFDGQTPPRTSEYGTPETRGRFGRSASTDDPLGDLVPTSKDPFYDSFDAGRGTGGEQQRGRGYEGGGREYGANYGQWEAQMDARLASLAGELDKTSPRGYQDGHMAERRNGPRGSPYDGSPAGRPVVARQLSADALSPFQEGPRSYYRDDRRDSGQEPTMHRRSHSQFDGSPPYDADQRGRDRDRPIRGGLPPSGDGRGGADPRASARGNAFERAMSSSRDDLGARDYGTPSRGTRVQVEKDRAAELEALTRIRIAQHAENRAARQQMQRERKTQIVF